MDQQQTGKLIAQRRKELGLTQKELAQTLHISDRTVSKWERGAGFPDTGTLIPLAEALTLPVLDLLQGQRSEPGEQMDPDTAVREALTHVQQARQKQSLTRKELLQLVGCLAVLWILLAFFGLLFLPVNRTQAAMVYQNEIPQTHTMVQWKGKLLYRLPCSLDFLGQVRTPQAQITLNPEHNLQIRLPLTWDQTTYVSRQSWTGNVHSQEGPFVKNEFYLDWWGKEFAFALTDGSVIATSQEAYDAFQTWREDM